MENKLKEQITKLQSHAGWRRLNEIRQPVSFLSILNCESWEDGHTQFLAWVLNPQQGLASHGLGDMPFRRFLRLIGHSIQNSPNARLARAVPGMRELAGQFERSESELELVGTPTVVTQHGQHADGRPDMYVEFTVRTSDNQEPQNVRLVLENKVDATEHARQTEVYWRNYGKDWAGLRNCHLIGVYLRPIKDADLARLNEPECVCKHFVQINYQALLDWVLMPSLAASSNAHTSVLLTQYIQTLTYAAERRNQIMAMTPEDQKLMASCYEENEELFAHLAEALGFVNHPAVKDDRKPLARITKSAEPAPPFIAPLRDRLLMMPGLSPDWVIGGKAGCITLKHAPTETMLGELRKADPETRFERLELYIGNDGNKKKRPNAMQLRLLVPDGTKFHMCKKSRLIADVERLRRMVKEELATAGGRDGSKRDSTNLCNYGLTGDDDEQVRFCEDAVSKIIPVVRAWFEGLPKS